MMRGKNPILFIDPFGLDTLDVYSDNFNWDNVDNSTNGDVVVGKNIIDEGIEIKPNIWNKIGDFFSRKGGTVFWTSGETIGTAEDTAPKPTADMEIDNVEDIAVGNSMGSKAVGGLKGLAGLFGVVSDVGTAAEKVELKISDVWRDLSDDYRSSGDSAIIQFQNENSPSVRAILRPGYKSFGRRREAPPNAQDSSVHKIYPRNNHNYE